MLFVITTTKKQTSSRRCFSLNITFFYFWLRNDLTYGPVTLVTNMTWKEEWRKQIPIWKLKKCRQHLVKRYPHYQHIHLWTRVTHLELRRAAFIKLFYWYEKKHWQKELSLFYPDGDLLRVIRLYSYTYMN